jgi:hypothetical protein
VIIEMSDYWTGTLAFEDIANDQLDDMEITVGWGAERPSNDIFPKLKSILSGKIVKSEIKRKMLLFEDCFKQI